MPIEYIYTVLAGFAAILGAYSLLALRRDGWCKWGTPTAFAGVLGAMLWLSVMCLGQPRPLWTFCLDNSSYKLISWSYVEKRAIYLWVVSPGGVDPIVISMPWSEGKAAELQKSMEQFKLNGTDAKMKPGTLARGTSGSIAEPGDTPGMDEPLKEGEMGQ